jgi:hypothetical protein
VGSSAPPLDGDEKTDKIAARKKTSRAGALDQPGLPPIARDKSL